MRTDAGCELRNGVCNELDVSFRRVYRYTIMNRWNRSRKVRVPGCHLLVGRPQTNVSSLRIRPQYRDASRTRSVVSVMRAQYGDTFIGMWRSAVCFMVDASNNNRIASIFGWEWCVRGRSGYIASFNLQRLGPLHRVFTIGQSITNWGFSIC